MLTLDTYEQVFDDALDHMNSDRNREAVSLWERALSQLDYDAPDWELEKSSVQLNMAICQLRLGQAAKCLTLCEEILGLYQAQDYLDSDDAQLVLSLMIQAYSKMGDFQTALGTSELALTTMFKNLSEYEPNTIAVATKQRADLAREIGEPDNAEKALGKALAYLDKLTKGGQDVTRCTASLLESRAANREQGMVFDLAEVDLSKALRLYEKLDGQDSDSVHRVRVQLGHLFLRSLEG